MSFPPLQYSPKSQIQRRRMFEKWAVALAIMCILISGRWWLVPAWRRARLLYWQHQCMVYNAPRVQVIFESDQTIHIVPREWSNFYSLYSPPGFVSQGTIFMHEMKTPTGQKRLVVVDETPWFVGGMVELGRVFKPGTAFHRPKEFVSQRDLPIASAMDKFRIFAGHIDSGDPSHFSFEIQTEDKKQIYDGWLQNDDRVIMGPRAVSAPSR